MKGTSSSRVKRGMGGRAHAFSGVVTLTSLVLAAMPGSADAGYYCQTVWKQGGYTQTTNTNGEIVRTPAYYPETQCERTYDGGVRGGRDRRARENQGGNGKGDIDTPNETAKEQRTDEKSGCGETAGNPVVLSTGNKLESETDFTTFGEMGLLLRRVYNHYWSATGLFGAHWLSNFDYTLAPSSDRSLLWLQRPDGRRIKFIRNPAGDRWYEDRAQPVASIVASGGGYLHYNEDGGTETYNADGYIVERRNEQGIAWTFRYDGKYLQDVTHSSGRIVRFVWDGGKLVEVRDPQGNAYRYAYQADALGSGRHRLASTQLPGAPATTITYHYEDARYPGALTGKSFNNVRYSTFAYNADGRAISTTHAGNVEQHLFDYVVETTEQVAPPPAPPPPGGYQENGDDPPGGWCEYQSGNGRICYEPRAMPGGPVAMSVNSSGLLATMDATKTIPVRMRVTVTNPLGKKAIHHYENDRKIRVEGLDSAHCPAASKFVSYDENGNEDVVTDFNNNRTDFNYDPKGHLIQQVEGLGSSAQRTTTYEWDGVQNRPSRIVVAGDRETTFAYHPDGRVYSITTKNLSANGVAGQTRMTTFQYTKHANGIVATKVEDGPLQDDTVTSTFNEKGDLVSVRDGVGHITAYADYNDMGQPGRITGPNGDVSQYFYDGRGRVTETRAIVAGQVQATRYSFNAAGMLSTVITPDNRARHFVYDAALRLVEEYEREPDGSYGRRTATYNAMSLPLSIEVKRTGYPFDTRVVGNIDGVVGNEAQGFQLRGWACTTGQNAPIGVGAYAGGAAGSGSYLGAFSAGLPSDSGIAAACAAQGTAYRFEIPLTDAVREAHGGKTAYVHGGSPAGAGDLLIAGSGLHAIPRLRPNVAPSGLSAPDKSITSSWNVTWNSAPRATRYLLEESANGAAWTSIHDAAGTSFTVSNKGEGTYGYRVSACNEMGCGPVSSVVSVRRIVAPTAAPVPSAPAVNDVGAYTVSLSSLPTATYYVIDESTNGTNWAQAHNGAATSASLTGRNTTIDYLYRARACNEAGCGPTSGVMTVQRAIYGAQYLGQAVFGLSLPGHWHTVTVYMRNTGNTTWTSGKYYNLGSQNPGDNGIWNVARVAVPGSVPPGATATFTFNVQAPWSVGYHNFQWRMVRDGYAWFGDATPNVVIEVATASIYGDLGRCPLYIGQTTCNIVVHWTSTRSDAQVHISNVDGTNWQLFSPNRSGAQNAPWISLTPKRFYVIAAGVVLASIDLEAYQLNEYPPDPDPPGGCVPNPPIYTCDPL